MLQKEICNFKEETIWLGNFECVNGGENIELNECLCDRGKSG